MDRNEALNLLKKYNEEEFHIRHALTVEGVMRYFAKELGYDEDFWGIVGLLHDIDFEKYPEEHCQKAPELLKEINAPEDMANILSKYMTVSEKCHYKKGCMSQDIKEVALSGELRYDSPADYTNMVKERFNNGIVLRYNNPHNGCSYKYIHTDGKEHTQENNCGMITAYVSANKINRRGLDNFVFVVTPKGIFPVGYDYPDSSVKRICSKENKLGDTGNIVSNGETCGEWIRRWDNADYWYN